MAEFRAVPRVVEPGGAKPLVEVLNERGARYGNFRAVALYAQQLFRLLDDSKYTSVQREALQTICSKLARIKCGDANYEDNWQDIAGYATLVLEELQGITNDNRASGSKVPLDSSSS